MYIHIMYVHISHMRDCVCVWGGGVGGERGVRVCVINNNYNNSNDDV